MSEWKECKLGDFFKVKHGFAFKGENIVSEKTNNILITPGNFYIGGGFKSDKFKYYKGSDYPSNYVLNKNDIIVTMTDLSKDSDTLGYSAKIPKSSRYKFLHNQRIGLLQFNNEVASKDFLYWVMRTREYQGYIVGSASGTSIMHTSPSRIEDYQFMLPQLSEQKAIASVLNSLDDKIDLLHRQNSTLETMAETLFRQWFVESVTEKWGTKKLGNIAVVQNGYPFSSKNYVEFQLDHLEVLKMGHIERGGGLRMNPKKDFVPRSERLKRWILNKDDLIMAMTDMKDNVVILGVPAMIDKGNKYVLNQRVARLYLKSNDLLMNNYLLYIQLKDPEFIATLQSKANSGVQVNLSTETIKDCDIIIPPMEIQKEKGKTITDFYLKKEKNDMQIKTLTLLRDLLLPKLMNGEATINV